jgi:GAF domain-containing protein
MSKRAFAAITLEAPSSPESAGSGLEIVAPEWLSARAAFGEHLLRAVVREQTFADFVREGLLGLMNLLKWEAGSVLEFDHEKEIYFFRAVTGRSSHQLPQFEIPRGQGVVGKVGEDRRTFLLGHPDPDRIQLSAIAQAVGFEVRSMVAIPLVIGGKLYGVLELLNPPAHVKLDEVTSQLEHLGQLFAVAIEARMKIAWRKA